MRNRSFTSFDNPFLFGLHASLLAFIYFILLGNWSQAEPHEQIIIFFQNSNSSVARDFEKILPSLKEAIATDGLEFILIDPREKGAPTEIAITPAIVFQNHLGRSIYQGRSNSLSRIENFVRTSRYIPQGKKMNHRRNIAVLQQEQSRIWSPIKIAPVTGSIPDRYDHNQF